MVYYLNIMGGSPLARFELFNKLLNTKAKECILFYRKFHIFTQILLNNSTGP